MKLCFIKRSSGFNLKKKKKKKKKNLNRSEPVKNKKTLNWKNSQLTLTTKLKSITLNTKLSNKPSLSTPRRHRCLSSTPSPLREPIATATMSNLSVSHYRSKPLFLSLSHSLFLLWSLFRLCRVCVFHRGFVWVSFDLFGFCLICLCILFHSIFNELFWVCLYFLFVFSFVGL